LGLDLGFGSKFRVLGHVKRTLC